MLGQEFYQLFAESVGDTLFTRSKNLEPAVGVRRLYLKFEGGNPTGTQKDRVALLQMIDAKRKGFGSATVATCGNYGASMTHWAQALGIRPVVFIPESYHTRRVEEMVGKTAQVRRVPGGYEDAVAASQEAARREGLYDSNPGPAAREVSLQAYSTLAYEVFRALDGAPDTVAVAVGNGTTLAGLHKGFADLHSAGVTDRIPRFVAASTQRGNPIVVSYHAGHRECRDLDPATVRETEVNEPLINWHAYDGDPALAALYASKGWAEACSDARLIRMRRAVHEAEGLSVMAASCAALVALQKVAEANRSFFIEDGRHVAVLTGRRF